MKGETYADVTLAALLRGTPVPSITLYAALFTDDAWTTEVAASGYARVALTHAHFQVPSGGVSTSAIVISFPAMAAQVVVESVALMDAASGGNIVYAGELASPTTVAASSVARFPIGGLTVQEA
jgi:hypothetical protein